ncbi:MAG: glucose-6-phosphate dehydrogenase, partial [Candidatus Marinimicrobia bacterium]|nr:glucose-6-phosphate dehydrogenase [Candidatus Neomarinimicrobiota bacterium]
RNSEPSDFRNLAERIQSLEEEHELPGNRVFYLAIPPVAYETTINGLGSASLNESPGWTKIVVEKPFGRDLSSAQKLNNITHKYFSEEQIYRIDHYLGKETVQNLLVFRFANAIFESIWNRDRIESVQITVSEELGVGHRADYYDKSGAIRDMMQNHLTQLLTLIAMEIPSSFDAESIRSEKIKVLKGINTIEPEDVVLGQYTAGMVEGEQVPGYLEEEGVPEESTTETFAAIRLEILNWRWQGVPFYIRTGKRLPERLTQIIVRFRRPPVSVFHPYDRCTLHSNALIITLQPNEGFDLQFEVKSPGEPLQMQTHDLGFRYADAFEPLPDAYRTLLLDVIQGDQTLFVHGEEVEASWKLYTPLLDGKMEIHPYEAGTWGPERAIKLPKSIGEQWTTL